MEHVKESNVARKKWDRSPDILLPKIDIVVVGRRDRGPVSNLARVHVQAEDRLEAGPFPKIKCQQAYAAADVENRIV